MSCAEQGLVHTWYNLLMLNRDLTGFFGRLLMGGAAALLLGVQLPQMEQALLLLQAIYAGKGPSHKCGIHGTHYETSNKATTTTLAQAWSDSLFCRFTHKFSNTVSQGNSRI